MFAPNIPGFLSKIVKITKLIRITKLILFWQKSPKSQSSLKSHKLQKSQNSLKKSLYFKMRLFEGFSNTVLPWQYYSITPLTSVSIRPFFNKVMKFPLCFRTFKNVSVFENYSFFKSVNKIHVTDKDIKHEKGVES